MKKYIYIFVSILILGISFLFINDITYSPLKERDLNVLFSDYNNANKKCSIDLLGITTDSDGNFTGVQYNGTDYSISDWNKLFETADPHKNAEE